MFWKQIPFCIVCITLSGAAPDSIGFEIEFDEDFKHPWFTNTRSSQGIFRPAPHPNAKEEAKQLANLPVAVLESYLDTKDEIFITLDAWLEPLVAPDPLPQTPIDPKSPVPVPFPEKDVLPPPGMAFFIIGAQGSGLLSCLFSGTPNLFGGHVWVEAYYSNGNKIAGGHNKPGFSADDLGLINSKITRQAWLLPEKDVILAMDKAEAFAKDTIGYKLFSHNCADCAEVAARSLGIQLPVFRTPAGIAAPEWMYRQLEASPFSYKDSRLVDAWNRLKNPTAEFKNQITELFMTEDVGVSFSNLEPCTYLNTRHDPFPSFITQPRYGGIALDLQADLKISASDIRGAIFDELTGQLILIGKKEILLPEMRIDDLAVAFKSIYGLQGKPPEDPAVSIDPISSPNKMKVSYYGQTYGTEFGLRLFEADFALKGLTLGALNSNVPGYFSLVKRFEMNRFIPQVEQWSFEAGRLIPISHHLWRTWISPDTLELVESENGDAMIFSRVQMKCLAESYGSNSGHEFHKQFADHFTSNYDAFCAEFPVFQEIKRLAQITGIVKWLKQNNIPVDLNYFSGYKNTHFDTPDSIDKFSKTYGWQHKSKRYSESLTGGVVLDAKLAKLTNKSADDQKDRVLCCKPTDHSMRWDLPDSEFAETCAVVKTKKIGNLHLDFVDLYYPNRNNFALSFTRSYDSFNDQDSGMGLGWSIAPACLEIPQAQIFVKEVNRNAPIYALLKTNQGDQLFLLKRFLTNGNLIFLPENGNELIQLDVSGMWQVQSSNDSMIFDAQGRLTKITDQNGHGISYEYKNNLLSAIKSDTTLEEIRLFYQHNRLAHTEGPDGKIVYYTYDTDLQLEAAENLVFQYDKNHRLKHISHKNKFFIFDGVYDDFNRLEKEKWGPVQSTNEYSLKDRNIKRSVTIDYKMIENLRGEK